MWTAIELDKPRRLRFDVNALADCEKQLGMGLGRLLQQEASFLIVRDLLWAGLKWEDPGLTIERTGRILQELVSSGKATLDELATVLLKGVFIDSGLFKRIPADALKELEGPNSATEAAKTGT